MVRLCQPSPWHRVVRLAIVLAVLTFWATVLFLGCMGQLSALWTSLRLLLGPSIFLLFCSWGIPEDPLCCASAEAPPAWARVSCATALLAGNIGVTAYPWMAGIAGDDFCAHWYGPQVEGWYNDTLLRNQMVLYIDGGASWITLLIALYCVSATHQPSLFIRSAVRYLVVIWFEGLVFAAVAVVSLCGDPNDPVTLTVRNAGREIGLFVNGATTLWISFLVLRRVEELEMNAGVSKGLVPLVFTSVTRQLAFCFGILCVSQVLGNIFATISLGNSAIAYGFHGGCVLALASVAMVFCLLHVLSAFQRPVSILFDEAREAADIPAAEALWAGQCLRLHRNVILISMFMTGCDLVMRSAMGFFPDQIARSTFGFGCYIVLWDSRNIVDAATIAVLCGFFGKGKAHEDICSYTADDALVRSYDADDSALACHPASSDPRWSCKVEELAGRGFVLDNLLDFFAELLQRKTMPSFHPLKSTTGDVVRQAIIPLSRRQPPSLGGSALASVWSGGSPVWPQRMVTHSWSNLFLHLVAAIVDDAIGEGVYYDCLATRLCSVAGLMEVRRQLQALHSDTLTYWVCAFSVNQHAGICGGFGEPPEDPTAYEKWMQKRVDTSSGQPHPVCTCGEPKFFSDDPVPCEMNKFDDMLDLMIERMPCFRQVIAMDGDFDLLRRCWCLAEIVRTWKRGMPQNTVMLSSQGMDSHYCLLKDLDVRECQATNREDKEFILSRIPSIDNFNAQLKWLVFSRQGIFNRQLKCPRDKLSAAARVAARVDRARSSSRRKPPSSREGALARSRLPVRCWCCYSQRCPDLFSEDLEASTTERNSSEN